MGSENYDFVKGYMEVGAKDSGSGSARKTTHPAHVAARGMPNGVVRTKRYVRTISPVICAEARTRLLLNAYQAAAEYKGQGRQANQVSCQNERLGRFRGCNCGGGKGQEFRLPAAAGKGITACSGGQ